METIDTALVVIGLLFLAAMALVFVPRIFVIGTLIYVIARCSVASATPDDMRYSWKQVAFPPENVPLSVVLTTPRGVSQARLKHSGLDRRSRTYSRSTGEHGFTLLTSRQGLWHCTVWIATNAPEGTMAHELRHCRGWIHQ